MNYQLRERLTNRILSGQVRCKYGNTVYILNSVTPSIKYEASELYFETVKMASFYELITEEDLLPYLIKHQLWNQEKDEKLEILPKEIEDCKIGIFESMTKSKDRKRFRDLLNSKKAELDSLYSEKHCFDYLTISGFAEHVKSKFIISQALGQNVVSDSLFEQVTYAINAYRINEKDYRDMVRNEPWRTSWFLSKSHSLFDYPVSKYTEEQKSACSWAKMYDNVYESTECPHESVIEDDDMLDGWLIKNRRKREAELLQKQGNEMLSGNEKIRNANEVFIVCQTQEDADKVDSLNDAYGKAIKRGRLIALAQQGSIKEQDLPDVKQELVMQANRMLSSRHKGV